MKLDAFITETLNSIIKGVKDSREFAKDNEARVNPHIGEWDKNKQITTYFKDEDGIRAVSNIDFDIAVTTTNEKETGGHGGINVLSIKVGANLKDTDLKETVSRIRFSVNVALPNTKA